MKTEQWIYTGADTGIITPSKLREAELVLVFGSPEVLRRRELTDLIRANYDKPIIAGCSSAGEIDDKGVYDDCAVVTAVKFSTCSVQLFSVDLTDANQSYTAGRLLASVIPFVGLRHVLILSEGLVVNGAQLVRGVTEILPVNVIVSGGLAADGDRFHETYVFDGKNVRGKIVSAIAFYGENLVVRTGSFGGWDAFGPERIVTRSTGPVVYELDNKPVLELYKNYLGEYAKDLPGSALLFPLSVRIGDNGEFLVRTVLGVDEETGSMRFAGDIPYQAKVRLMKANFNRLLDGAGRAAQMARGESEAVPDLALLISCVGRKLLLKQRTVEEVEAVREFIGHGTRLAGFYSYGEISPVGGFMKCDLHNQTMTITTYHEIA